MSNIKTKKRALIYCRVSTDKQRTEGSGLESQEKRCRDYCTRKDYQVVDVFRDSFTGGGDFMGRPAMRELIEYLETNIHEDYVVVFDDLKRLARDTVAHLKLRQQFRSTSTEVQCLNFNFEDTPEGEFVEIIIAAQGELERKQNKRQVVQKQKARLERGLWSFHAPKGYEMIKTEEYGKLCHPNKDAKSIKEALEGFASRRFAKQVDVVDFLLSKDFFPQKGKLPRHKSEKYLKTIKAMLTNVFYAGYIDYPKWEVKMVKGKHEPLIGLETFEAIQKRLNKESNTRYSRMDLNPDFPLRGLVNCSHCGRKLTGYKSKGRHGDYYYYYECKYTPDCPFKNKSIRRDDLHKGFEEFTCSLKSKQEFEELIKYMFDTYWKDEFKNLDKRILSLEKQGESIQESLRRIEDMLIDPKTSDAVKDRLSLRMEEDAQKLALIEEKKSKKPDLEKPYRNALDEVLEMMRNPYQLWVTGNLEQKHEVFPFFFEANLRYDKENGYRTPEKTVILRLFERLGDSDTLDVEKGGVEPPSKIVREIDSTMIE